MGVPARAADSINYFSRNSDDSAAAYFSKRKLIAFDSAPCPFFSLKT
jgi:hypothetical protein